MKEINPEWKEYQLDPVKRKYLIPRKDYAITDEKEIRSSLGVKETQTPPSLIVIDEISKFTAYDLDQIDRFAKKYGITVLVAGLLVTLISLEQLELTLQKLMERIFNGMQT